MNDKLTEEQMIKIRKTAGEIARILADKKFTRDEFAMLIGFLLEAAKRFDEEILK